MASGLSDPPNDQGPSGRILIEGETSAEVIFSSVPLSFMMGVDSKTGVVIDKHHPLVGESLKDKAVVMPCGRGSCSGSGVILELLAQDAAPAALIFNKMEHILTLGVMIAKVMFNKAIPVIIVDDTQAFSLFGEAQTVRTGNKGLHIGNAYIPLSPPTRSRVDLTEEDQRLLMGINCSVATRLAMEVVVDFAAIQGAPSLVDVSQVHIDACCYVGRSSLLVPQRLQDLGGKFAVPSTCNSLSVDRQRWQQLGADPELSRTASQVGDIYLAMGSTMSFTCTPYVLETKPRAGEQVGWGESNAVVFANSVLGARTQKYPDYLDVMVALTGRAPYTGCHSPEGRLPSILITVPNLEGWDDSLFPLIGYSIGEISGVSIPLIYGLEESNASVSDLKGFSAAFATTSSAPMFHMNGVTTEALNNTLRVDQGLRHVILDITKLKLNWRGLNTATDRTIDLVSLGNPHFTLQEVADVALLCDGQVKAKSTQIIITTSRYVYGEAAKRGYIEKLENFGARLLTDTCWCMIEEPVLPIGARTIMTNSAKYAHYGPGTTKRGSYFGSLASCVHAACTGEWDPAEMTPAWLFGP